MHTKPTPKKPPVIPADLARGILEAAQAAQAKSVELQNLQLVQRVRLLEAVIKGLGLDLEAYDVIQAADGSLEFKEKAQPEEAKAAGA
jgi:hypothetical protein